MHLLPSPNDQTGFHRALAHFNHDRVEPALPHGDWEEVLTNNLQFTLAEGRFLEQMRHAVAPALPSADLGTDEFLEWFEALQVTGAGQQHDLFNWLAEQADMDAMRWFLTQEAAGEAGFDDLLAFTQVRLPSQAKLECARNFWDEMGHGKLGAMHAEMLDKMVRDLGLAPCIDTTVWESLALSNTMLGLAISRRYTYQSLGALGVIELTAPGRVKKVAAGMTRLGLAPRSRAYFDVHATLDVFHARTWLQQVIRPLIDADPQLARSIAEGALMRLACGSDCFDRYAEELTQSFERGDDPMPSSVPKPQSANC
ncbi:MAG: iron-containing redox enzyme family protein [Herminiimonas sp.]|nr:iron-containing redox enzyme family protein [Herminiimonas sp.]